MWQRFGDETVLLPRKDSARPSLKGPDRGHVQPSAANHAAAIASDATKRNRSRDAATGNARCTRRRVRLVCSLLIAVVYASSKLLVVWLMHLRALHTCTEGDGEGHPPAMSAKEYLLQNFRQPHRSAGQGGRRQGRPTLYLHVGLPKTGTTFLQCSLCRDAAATDPILLADNLVYLGTCPSSDCGVPPRDDRFLHHWSASFFRGSAKEPGANPIGPVPHNDTARLRRFLPPDIDARPLPPPVPTLVQRLQDVRDRHMDALIIFEGCHVFSHRHIRALSELFQRQKWTVRVLVAYRPLYQWLPSKYNSLHKPARNAAARVWPNRTEEVAVPAPGGGMARVPVTGAPLLPFALANRGAFSQLVQDVEHYRQHPAETVRDNYRRHFADVRVLPLPWLDQWQQRVKEQAAKNKDPNERVPTNDSSVDPLLEYLFCEALATPRVCRTVRSGGLGARLPLNPSVALDYDLLAVAAYERRLFRERDRQIRRTKRGRVTQMVQQRQERDLGRTAKDFPQQCLDDGELVRLEQLSLRLERQLFLANWTQAQEELHHQGFVNHRSKYCWVDVDQVLQDNGWREFFQSISEPKQSDQQQADALTEEDKTDKDFRSGDENEDDGDDGDGENEDDDDQDEGDGDDDEDEQEADDKEDDASNKDKQNDESEDADTDEKDAVGGDEHVRQDEADGHRKTNKF